MSDVLQEQLRNAHKQTEGTSNVLLKAADEIAMLKRQLGTERARVEQLEDTLGKVRDQVNSLTGKVLGA